MEDIDVLKRELSELDNDFRTAEKIYQFERNSLSQKLVKLIRDTYHIIYCIHAEAKPIDSWNLANGYTANSFTMCYYSSLEKAQNALTCQESTSDHFKWTYSIVIKQTKDISDMQLLQLNEPPPNDYPYIGD